MDWNGNVDEKGLESAVFRRGRVVVSLAVIPDDLDCILDFARIDS